MKNSLTNFSWILAILFLIIVTNLFAQEDPGIQAGRAILAEINQLENQMTVASLTAEIKIENINTKATDKKTKLIEQKGLLETKKFDQQIEEARLELSLSSYLEGCDKRYQTPEDRKACKDTYHAIFDPLIEQAKKAIKDTQEEIDRIQKEIDAIPPKQSKETGKVEQQTSELLAQLGQDLAAAQQAFEDFMEALNAKTDSLGESNFETSFYPNPTSSTLSVNYHADTEGLIQFSIYNSLGQLQIQHSSNGDLSGTMTFNLENLAPGLYILEIIHENEITKSKFIIER